MALVDGFDPVGRLWIGRAQAADARSCVEAPPLDGALLIDLASRSADSTDEGNIVQHTPAAALRPGSVEDIAKMIGFCRKCGIKVAARGQHHTTFGQGLSSGLIIENRWLNTTHSIGPEGADVDAGVLWFDMIRQSFAQGLTPPVLTGYTQLSIAGTLSVGGVSLTNGKGAQVDRVQELQVVTGKGEIVWCSEHHERDLFEAVLAGLGQCGIITRARVDLVRAKSMARQYTIQYTEVAALFRDMRTLLHRGELDGMYAICVPSGANSAYLLLPTIYFNQSSPPDNNHLLRGLSVSPGAAAVQDLGYVDQVTLVDALYNNLAATMMFDQLIKPWFDVFLPDHAVEQYVSDVVPTLTPEDVGPTGFVLILAQKRSELTRPFFRVPDTGSDWTYLFDILTSSSGPGANPAFVSKMLARNRKLFEKARAAGGTRYPIGSIPFDHRDWVVQYGKVWDRFVELKNRFDPDDILTPGLGIFP